MPFAVADPGVDPHGAKEPPVGLDLVQRSIDDRLNWNHPLWQKSRQTRMVGILIVCNLYHYIFHRNAVTIVKGCRLRTIIILLFLFVYFHPYLFNFYL